MTAGTYCDIVPLHEADESWSSIAAMTASSHFMAFSPRAS
jgi:hypothetical protein